MQYQQQAKCLVRQGCAAQQPLPSIRSWLGESETGGANSVVGSATVLSVVPMATCLLMLRGPTECIVP